MAITNVTAEVEELRKRAAIFTSIEALSVDRAHFLLKSLILAGHVPEWVMQLGVGLAETVRE